MDETLQGAFREQRELGLKCTGGREHGAKKRQRSRGNLPTEKYE